MEKTNSVIQFLYNADGIRTSKTVNNVEHVYTLNGSQIVSEAWGGNLLIYLYDESGSPIGMQYRNTGYAANSFTTFYFEKNLQGDIVALYDANGAKVLSYNYDAWGNQTVTWHNSYGSNIYAIYNPFRYRGYYYDTETGLYYLQRRYYNPQWGRFLNADGLVSTGQGLLSYNMYAYCGNNPVMYIDPTGERFRSHLSVKEARGDGDRWPVLVYEVPLYKQGLTNLCWAYCDLMIDDYNQNRTSSELEQFTYTRIRAIVTYDRKKEHILPWDHFGSCSASEERYHPENIIELYDIIKEYGPVYARYVNQFDQGHLIVVTGVDVYKNIVYTNNPHGVRGEQTFEEFQNGVCRPWYMPKINQYTFDTILIPE